MRGTPGAQAGEAGEGRAAKPLTIRELGRTDYRQTLQQMRDQVQARIRARHAGEPDPGDELWLTEHHAVYTLGRGARRDHLHEIGEIPVVETERGGHVTYHGPGQLLAYPLIDLPARGLGVRRYVCALEAAVIETLAASGLKGQRQSGAPGIYLDDGSKIASIGLKVSYGFTYHGVSLNVAMALEPFSRIDPCGYPDLSVTDMATTLRWAGLPPLDPDQVRATLAAAIARQLGHPRSADTTD